MAESYQVPPSTPTSMPTSTPPEGKRRGVIGIYGIPGSGKTYLLNQLKQTLECGRFEFFEGSELIALVVPGGLKAFQKLPESEKTHWRQVAIQSIAKADDATKNDAIVVGHYMFWNEGDDVGTSVVTEADLQTFTHILYLNTPADNIRERRQQDKSRKRPEESVTHLQKWQQAEQSELRRLCYQHGILFSIISEEPNWLRNVTVLLQELQYDTETRIRADMRNRLDRIVHDSGRSPCKTVLIMDADKTLTPMDTGELFSRRASQKTWPSWAGKNPLKEVFDSNMGYSYQGFRQASLLYHEAGNNDQFGELCHDVACATFVYPDFVSLLQAAAQSEHTEAVVITCGLTPIWRMILQRHGLGSQVKVIGGERPTAGSVVTGDIKADLVSHVKKVRGKRVYAFGDSPLDLGMLKAADRAIVVVGDEKSRSKSMDKALLEAIDKDGLQACQVVLPSTASPRLTLAKLPLIQLTAPEFIGEIFSRAPPYPDLDLTHATDRNAAMLLTTPMRDSRISGPALRKAHRLVGRYLATEFLSAVCGVEVYPIPHVQGHTVSGHRMLHEEQTLIVPLMRGGEPMALGVNDALPRAMLRHASRPEDLEEKHLHGRLSVILVDSVVNSGKSMLEFVQHVRKLHATVRIIAVAGVVQKDALGILGSDICCQVNFKLVALRLSDNKYAGKGTTDTGNRLFNTTHLD